MCIVHSRTYLVNSLAMTCKIVALKSHLQYLIVLLANKFEQKLRTSSPFLCKYHFLHLTVSILQYQFQTDEGYPS
jgi:hypothetical protein